MLTFTLDDARLQQILARLDRGLDAGFPRAMKRADQVMARSIDLNFRQRGRPAWAPLSPMTLRLTAGRRVAGDAPLRLTDTLRRSVVATAGSGARGQVSRVGPFEAVRGTNLPYAATHQGGRKRIPARPFLLIHEADKTEIVSALGAEIAAMVKGL